MISRQSAKATANQIIERSFSKSCAAFLAGSVVRGEETSTSDLDIVIVISGLERAYRQSLIEAGWPIELFVHSPNTLNSFFQSDISRRAPSLVQMCAEGLLIKNEKDLGSQIKTQAQTLLKKGPPALSSDEIERFRYGITDLLDDLIGNQRVEEGVFIVSRLVEQTLTFYLSFTGHWSGTGKWLWRHFKNAFPEWAPDWNASIQKAYTGDTHSLIQIVEVLLEKTDGRLFDGYLSMAPKK